ncbi:phage tail protein [Niallia sp. 03190]|uniref:phage tail protein n=1 Tax=Niallia sp. 03190 TaxID=3458061 RepID=UPI004044F476
MGKIGSFGGVTFEVSTKKVLTFKDFSRSGDARWSQHDVSKKPISEFIGPGQETISIAIVLKRSFGVNPEDVLKTLRSFRDKGKVGPFVIGNKSISNNYWYIANIQENNGIIDAKGRIHDIEVTLSLEEYDRPPVKSKKKLKPKKKKVGASKKKIHGTITIKVGMLNCRAKPSLEGHILKVLRKNQKYKVYGIKYTDIPWYDLGGGKYCSARPKYTSLNKG